MKKLIFTIAVILASCTIEVPMEQVAEMVQPTDPIAKPEAPLNLKSIPGDGQIILSWDSSVDATRYNIYFSTTQGVHDTMIENVTSPYTHTGLVNDKTNYYVISALNSGGESPDSVEMVATPGTIDNMNGTISIMSKGLTWPKCSQSNAFGGNTYDSAKNDCSFGLPSTLQHCPVAYECDTPAGVELLDNTGSEVYTTCKTLSIAGGGWRVPTAQELAILHTYYVKNTSLWPDIMNDYYWPTNGYAAPYNGYFVWSIKTGGYQTVPIAIASFYKYVICVK